MPFISNGTTWGSSATGFKNAAAVWDALAHDPAPVPTPHADAGVGATASITGNRMNARLTVTTGASPVSGGRLCTLALLGYTNPPTVIPSASDSDSSAAFPRFATTSTVATLWAAGELEPSTTYTFDIVVMGV